MLKKARGEMPESVFESERFEIPKVKGHLQGNKTVISNFFVIADTLGRTPEHVLKYILKELATPGNLTRSALILGAKVPASRINEKIRKYATEYVLCRDCGKNSEVTLTRDAQLTGLQLFQCNHCGSNNTEIIEGKKANVKNIKIQ